MDSDRDMADLQDKSPAEIEADIERTRDRISSDLDAISYKLSPQRLRERAQDTLSSAQEAVMSTVQEVTQAVSDRAKETSSGFFDLIKDNPLPAALIGLGVGLLVTGGATAASSASRGSSNDRRFSDGYRSDGYDSFETTPGAYAENYGSSFGGGSSDSMPALPGSRSGLGRWIEEQPLAFGLVGLLVGTAIGLGLPGTRYENRVMGEAGGELREKAKHLVHDAVDVVKETARDLRSEAQQQLGERGISVEGAKDMASKLGQEVKAAAKDVTESVKQTAKLEAEKKGFTQSSNQGEKADDSTF